MGRQLNQNLQPFTWTKTPDEILNSLADYLAKITKLATKYRYELRIVTSGAGH